MERRSLEGTIKVTSRSRRLAGAWASRHHGSPMPALQDASQNRMSLPSDATDAAVIKAFAGIPALLEQSPALIARGRLLDCDCLLGLAARPFHASIRAGRIVDLAPARVLMR